MDELVGTMIAAILLLGIAAAAASVAANLLASAQAEAWKRFEKEARVYS